MKMRGVALKLFASFLYGQTERVRIGSNLSLPLPVGVGVPRGSVTLRPYFLYLSTIYQILNLRAKYVL